MWSPQIIILWNNFMDNKSEQFPNIRILEFVIEEKVNFSEGPIKNHE